MIAPKVDDSVDLSDLQISFYARGTEDQYVHLGVIEDPTLPSTFVTIQSFPVSSFLTQYTGYLSNYTGTSKYVALKVAPTTYVSYYFDDFVMDRMVPERPFNLELPVMMEVILLLVLLVQIPVLMEPICQHILYIIIV